MKISRKSNSIREVFKELGPAELTELNFQKTQQSNVVVGCKNFSGDITLCAVLCDGMHCDGFDHGGKIPSWPIPCSQLVKCKGFTGTGGTCGAFKLV